MIDAELHRTFDRTEVRKTLEQLTTDTGDWDTEISDGVKNTIDNSAAGIRRRGRRHAGGTP